MLLVRVGVVKDPVLPSATMFPSIVQDVDFSEVQLIVEVSPDLIVDGIAVIVIFGEVVLPSFTTFTFTVLLIVPAGPLHTTTYDLSLVNLFVVKDPSI